MYKIQTTITANASGVISALASSGSGITIDKIYEENNYFNKLAQRGWKYVKLPYVCTYWSYFLVNMMYVDSSQPWFGHWGSFIIDTRNIITHSRDVNTYMADPEKIAMQCFIDSSGPNKAYVAFPNTTHIGFFNLEQIIIWGITMPSKSMLGTIVSTANG